MSTAMENRDIRQRELIPPEKLLDTKVTVVGVGAIGRQVALQLAAIGVPKIKIIDFDSVEAENLASQGFYESDMNRPKVEAVADVCKSINPAVVVSTANGKFRSMQFIGGVFFCCVDGIDTRKSIFNSVEGRADLFVDGRMSAEYMRILTVCNNESREYYPTTLFPAAEAHNDSCTSKTTIYCANIAAGMMVAQFAKWLRGHDIDKDIDVNLLTNEMGAK
jgi:sulfur carrier protein ThiS adenylyltransferase